VTDFGAPVTWSKKAARRGEKQHRENAAPAKNFLVFQRFFDGLFSGLETDQKTPLKRGFRHVLKSTPSQPVFTPP